MRALHICTQLLTSTKFTEFFISVCNVFKRAPASSSSNLLVDLFVEISFKWILLSVGRQNSKCNLQELYKLPWTWVFVSFSTLLHLCCKIREPCQITVAKNWNTTALKSNNPNPRKKDLEGVRKNMLNIKISWGDPQQGEEKYVKH